MLFHSYLFTLCFLPISLLCYYLLRKLNQPALAMWSLIGFSLFFYGWWNANFIWLLIGSTIANYLLSRLLLASRTVNPSVALAVLVLGIGGNLAVLAHYKYWCLLGASGACQSVILPLAISFFTFQQIEFLLDTWNGRMAAQKFLPYALFVTFFPHLIAGPITRHSEMMPQFERPSSEVTANLSIGLTIFAIGLGKKAFLADPLALLVEPAFLSAGQGNAVPFLPAWLAAVGFTLQLYFDFSGYSDMAIGIGRMFGIKLPLNFNSPFKAVNIVDFWQRWHLTLTRYINAHLYNPMAVGLARWTTGDPGSFRNLMIVMAVPTVVVMTIAGIWHGAGSQFVVFGAMHGVMLASYHAFRLGTRRWPRLERLRQALPTWLCVAATFYFVVVSFVFFKAPSIDAAFAILKGMSGFSWGPVAPEIASQIGFLRRFALLLGQDDLRPLVHNFSTGYFELLLLVPVCLLILWFTPNTQQIMASHLNTPMPIPGETRPPVQYSTRPLGGRWGVLATWQPTHRDGRTDHGAHNCRPDEGELLFRCLPLFSVLTDGHAAKALAGTPGPAGRIPPLPILGDWGLGSVCARWSGGQFLG